MKNVTRPLFLPIFRVIGVGFLSLLTTSVFAQAPSAETGFVIDGLPVQPAPPDPEVIPRFEEAPAMDRTAIMRAQPVSDEESGAVEIPMELLGDAPALPPKEVKTEPIA
ncbi:MAG TPA: hypothetical protein PK648_13595, partial [Verrucomicrobiales bacterium]|nr:hypothetical protein [Verrucomicrobiales bacterium]